MPQFNPFPVGYQPYNGGYQYPPQPMQVTAWNNQAPQIPTQSSPPQQDLIPTIRMDMKQVENIEAISKNPPVLGTTGAYMTKDEKLIIFRTMYANGEYTDRIYDERPPAPPVPAFDPKEYLRKDEFDKRVNAIVADQVAQLTLQASTPRRTPKKGDED